MKSIGYGWIIVLMTVSIPLSAVGQEPPPLDPQQKPRVLVLTDITNEPDDEESMVRFLAYANEYDIEGLIATTSCWLRNKIRPQNIIERIKAYGEARPNLMKHAEGFPTKEHLLSVTKSGLPEFGMKGVGKNKSSEGSKLIIRVVDSPDPRPVWISVWGGANCLAQALWDVKNTRSAEDLKQFVSKLRVYTISDQDDSGRWMRLNFPGLFYVVSPCKVGHREYYKATWTGIAGDRHYSNGPFHKFKLVDNPWLEKNIIQNHGPLGALYPKLAYIMEGDTPSFIGLIDNGLGSHISPAYGGWGGRYVYYESYGENQPIWTNVMGARDTVEAEDGQTYTSSQATIWRWREAFQHDFAARMDWCVAETYEKANHNPTAVLNAHAGKKVVYKNVKVGETVQLDASGSKDPDGDALLTNWFQYREASGFRAGVDVSIKNSNATRASFVVPKEKSGTAIHIILELKDDGDPALYA